MATHSRDFNPSVFPQEDSGRVYSICAFDNGLVVPRVKLVDAESDEDAITAARSISPWAMREIWDRHRLVAIIPAMN